MIPVNSHYLHSLLVNFKDVAPSYSFARKSMLRTALESFSKKGCSSEDLSCEETNHLKEVISNYIANNKITDDSIDSRMLHRMMCKFLLQYTLDHGSNHLTDEFKLIIEEYFLKINQEVELVSPEILRESDFKGLLIWIEMLIQFPDLYITHLWIAGHGNDYTLNALDLSECGCVDASHDRIFGNVRLKVEQLVLEACEKVNSSVNRPLKLLSMGPGEGLQDFIIIFKLLNSGVRNIELTLLEPKYKSLLAPVPDYVREIYCRDLPEGAPLPEKYFTSNQSQVYSIIRAISLLNRQFEDANISIYQYSSLEDLNQDAEIVAPYDVVYAIDFDDYSKEKANKDFHETANYLKPEGQAILSTHNQILNFSAHQTQKSKEYLEKNRIEFDPIKSEENRYRLLNGFDSFFLTKV